MITKGQEGPDDPSANSESFRSALNNLHITFTDSIGELGSFSGRTEEEFLRLGPNLHDFQQRAADITAAAVDVANLVGGEEIVCGIQNLEQMVGRMNFCLTNALEKNRYSSSSLVKLLQVLDGLDTPLASFRKINKMLRMLGISTRIESTRLAEGGEGFDNLANDVSQLYVQIEEKASSVNDLKKNLFSVIRRTVDRINNVEREQRAKMETTLGQATASLRILTDSNARCKEFASSIASDSADVSRNISEVVMSMQFHDISRQQIEHVSEALEEICHRLNEFTDDGKGAKDRSELAGIVSDVVELQVAQLSHAISELTEAVDRIIDNLRGIAEMEENISREAKEMTGAVDGAGSSFFRDMEINLNSITNELQRCADENGSMVRSLEEVDETIEEISHFVGSIQTIGEEIELIAINSQIKAARTGIEGAALGVLAEAIQRLSQEARSQTGAISGMLEGITNRSKELCKEIDSESSILEEEVTEIKTGLGNLLHILRGANDRFMSLLEGIESSVTALSRDIVGTTSGITVTQLTNTVLGGVVDKMTAAAAMISPYVDQSLNRVKLSRGMTDHSNRYTMKSERKIHEKLTAGKGCDDIPLTVLQPGTNPQSGDFGENVELF